MEKDLCLYMRKETLINENYLQNWNIQNVAKEFAQNNVFAMQQLHATGRQYYKNGVAYWEDDGAGFGLEMLLIGMGAQKSIDNAPGENSEGMKVSLMVACRENKECCIEIPGYTIIPKLEESSLSNNNYRELILYIYKNNREKGVLFSLECDKEDFDNANNSFGFLLANNEEKALFDKNSIIKSAKGKNLYINGVRIQIKTPMLYSYNLVGKGLSNRDRNAVDLYEINNHIWKKLLSNTSDKELITNLLKNSNNIILENMEVYPYRITNKETWIEAIEEFYNEEITKICYATGTKTDNRARYRRFKVIRTPNESMKRLFNYFRIYSSENVVPTKDTTNREYIQLKDITTEQHDNLKRARNLIQKHYTKIDYKIRYVNNPMDEYNNQVLGLCDYNNQIIILNTEVLNNFKQTFETLLHECVHMVSHAGDCTEEFEREWGKACLSFALGTERQKRK